MYDASKVLIGLIVFVGLLFFPVWYNAASGKAGYSPELVKPVKGETCVAATDYMRSNHMDLLNDWRDEVVRESDRVHVDEHGNRFEKSLTNTCLDCHADKAGFCDQCHNYMGVDPYCWDCHVIPTKEVQ